MRRSPAPRLSDQMRPWRYHAAPGRWTLEDRFASAWHYLPVEVPAGTCALRVELEYERSAAAVMDLGCLGPAGFRGWSGGARASFVIAADAATPGYLPGELEPGLWQVIIGLHRVPPAGADYRLTAEVTRHAGRAAPARCRPPCRRWPNGPAPRAAAPRWPPLAGRRPAHPHGALGRGDDGPRAGPVRGRPGSGLPRGHRPQHRQPSRELPAAAAGTASCCARPGGHDRAGHASALGDVGWIDFREPPDAWLDGAGRAGGLLSVNHPIGGHVSWTRADETAPAAGRGVALELAGPALDAPLAWWLAWDPAAIPVGGSDWHRPGSDAPPGAPTTWVEAESADPDAVLAAIGAGRTAISAGRDGPVLLRAGDELVACAADGTILTGPDGPRARVSGDLARFPAAAGCHRLTDPTGATLALTA